MPVSDTDRVGPGFRAIRRGVSTSSISLLAGVFVAGLLPSEEAFEGTVTESSQTLWLFLC